MVRYVRYRGLPCLAINAVRSCLNGTELRLFHADSTCTSGYALLKSRKSRTFFALAILNTTHDLEGQPPMRGTRQRSKLLVELYITFRRCLAAEPRLTQ